MIYLRIDPYKGIDRMLKTATNDTLRLVNQVFDQEMLNALRKIYAQALILTPGLTIAEFFQCLPDSFIPGELEKEFTP